MVELLTDYDVQLAHERWQDHNRRGLAFAAAADWPEAADAFAAAVEALSSDPDELVPHEPLALVLGNLAQACFRAGRLDEALGHAQRACALRVALTGEGGMPAARARMDLAVMLATAGRREEAMTLVQRAIAAVEHHVGEEDPRLTVVLENAARIALSSGAAASAEPFLLRLHALLDLHEESTDAADRLLARIAEVRAIQRAVPGEREDGPSATPEMLQARTTPEETSSIGSPTGSSGIAEETTTSSSADTASSSLSDSREEWEDQPLRDAVALTDVLLRTTPSGVPAIADTASSDTASSPEASDERVAEEPAALEELTPEPDAPPAALVLDFAVQHGLIDEEYASAPAAPMTPQLELVETEVETEIGPAVEPESEPAAQVEQEATALPIAPSMDLPIAATASVVDSVDSPVSPPSRTVAVVLPTPHAGSQAVETTPHVTRESGRPEQVTASRIPWIPIAGGVLAAAAAGWWFFLR